MKRKNMWVRKTNNEVFCLFRISDFIKHVTVLHNEELDYFYWSPDVSSVIKSRRKGNCGGV
jgi:hypothetical protein